MARSAYCLGQEGIRYDRLRFTIAAGDQQSWRFRDRRCAVGLGKTSSSRGRRRRRCGRPDSLLSIHAQRVSCCTRTPRSEAVVGQTDTDHGTEDPKRRAGDALKYRPRTPYDFPQEFGGAISQTVAFLPPLIALFQVRVIKRNYRADGSHLTSTSGMPNGIARRVSTGLPNVISEPSPSLRR